MSDLYDTFDKWIILKWILRRGIVLGSDPLSRSRSDNAVVNIIHLVMLMLLSAAWIASTGFLYDAKQKHLFRRFLYEKKAVT